MSSQIYRLGDVVVQSITRFKRRIDHVLSPAPGKVLGWDSEGKLTSIAQSAGGGGTGPSRGSTNNSSGNTTIQLDPSVRDHSQTLNVTGDAGTRIVILGIADRLDGDRIRLKFKLTTTPNIVIQVRNGTAGGTVLYTWTTDATGDDVLVEAEFNGTSWDYMFSVNPA